MGQVARYFGTLLDDLLGRRAPSPSADEHLAAKYHEAKESLRQAETSTRKATAAAIRAERTLRRVDRIILEVARETDRFFEDRHRR